MIKQLLVPLMSIGFFMVPAFGTEKHQVLSAEEIEEINAMTAAAGAAAKILGASSQVEMSNAQRLEAQLRYDRDKWVFDNLVIPGFNIGVDQLTKWNIRSFLSDIDSRNRIHSEATLNYDGDCSDMSSFNSFQEHAETVELRREKLYGNLLSQCPREYQGYTRDKISERQAQSHRAIELAREKYHQDQKNCLRMKELNRLLLESMDQ